MRHGTNLKYNWQYKPNINNGVWTNAGSTTNTLKVKAITNNEYLYRCLVSNDVYSGDSAIQSDAACLYIITSQVYRVKYVTETPAAPKITKQPLPAQAPMGEKVTFTVEAEGDNLVYQWQYKSSVTNGTWTNATKNEGTGFNTNIFTTIALMDSHSGWEYRCIVRDNDGYYYGDQNAVISDSAMVEVTKDGYSRVVYINESYDIIENPQTVLTFSGESATFKVSATGNTTLTYRWLYKTSDENSVWTEVPTSIASGTQTDTLVINKVLDDYSGYMFRCSVGGSIYVYEKSLLSNVAYLLTIEPAQIIKARIDVITYMYEDGTQYDSEWTNQNVIVTVPITDEETTWVAIKKGSGDWSVEPTYASIEKNGDSEIRVTFSESINDEIYVRRVNSAGNATREDTESKVIRIDKELPLIEEFTYETKDKELILIAKVSDKVSGLMCYAITTEETNNPSWIAVENQSLEEIERVVGGSGIYYIYAKDNAGNMSETKSIKAIKDITAPKGEITVREKYLKEGKVEYTNQISVTLEITASDNVTSTSELQMALYREQEYNELESEDEIVWEKYASEKEWVLQSENAEEKIYLILKDEAGNISVPID